MRPDGRPSGPGRPDQARVFFALWPDDRVRAGLQRAATDGARRFGGRAMLPDTLHLTLAFIGNVAVDEIPKLEEAAAGVQAPAFCLTLDRLGFWDHNRILWMGSRGGVAGLAQLASDLGGRLQAAGYGTGIKAGRPFAPHVTLVRNVPEKRPELPELPALDWDCDHFVLVRSRLAPRGSTYETIGRWPLHSS